MFCFVLFEITRFNLSHVFICYTTLKASIPEGIDNNISIIRKATVNSSFRVFRENSIRGKLSTINWQVEITIDKFIQVAQLNAKCYDSIKWISYDRFQGIEQMAKGDFSTIYYASREIHISGVLGGEEYTKADDVYSFAIIAYKIATGIQPCSDVPHDEELALKIQLFLKIRITIQIDEAEEFSKNQTSDTTTTTSLNYKTHPQTIYTSRLLDFSNLPKPSQKGEKEII
ncbi:hypothetical protein Glove_139g268 [Diversispora epigaea]|uniref:Protein kinase domain-containing protein n=1 Tax=Diversispora epigaea TaxID=1348612 RepID=A0A397IVM7_9GLOM|nr:hypothetical protein Glove_139g268 [Diversispora epigaea]